ncbi:hypothetical protein [Streptomyces lydicus]|uniref:hypothetical protein n=1 Tax=Streptomyces lydicus TaxID=47763 RepID=UPI003787CFFB
MTQTATPAAPAGQIDDATEVRDRLCALAAQVGAAADELVAYTKAAGTAQLEAHVQALRALEPELGPLLTRALLAPMRGRDAAAQALTELMRHTN